MIPVNKPFLPPKSKYFELVDEIWDKVWLTNNGPNVRLLESKVRDYLGLQQKPVLVNNGTIALQIAIKSLNLSGDIITTPFSYVATVSSLVWEHCTPVFADIDLETFNLDPASIEKVITSKTKAILATHVFGNPCDVVSIQRIADKHGLKVIYDAAHAFGVRYKNESIYNYGDISTLSLHSTKLFHCVEGGLLTTKNSDLLKTFELMRNFGHDGPYRFSELGINGKNSEFHAAMGLVNLEYATNIIQKRKKLVNLYLEKLKGVELDLQKWNSFASLNYAYMPVVFKSEGQLLNTSSFLENKGISTRRYFYPTLDNLPYIQESDELQNAASIAKRILCLPLFFDLTEEQVEWICSNVKMSF